MRKRKMTTQRNQGPMIHLSRKACLDEDPIKMYDALLKLQKSVGCTFRKLRKNDEQFDGFVGQAYLKAMTDHTDGRTVLIVGKDQHGVAGQGYFDIDPDPYTNKSGKGFANLIRWAHLGDSIQSGILLVDFEHCGIPHLGNATNFTEVQKTLEHICSIGFDTRKNVYLTDCVSIRESSKGAELRESENVITLNDWLKHDFSYIKKQNMPEQKIVYETKIVYRESSPQIPYDGCSASSALTESWG